MTDKKLNRAWAVFEVKEFKENNKGERIIKGIATTPSTDRYGDIVESAGAEFDLPLPLLLQHDHDKPVGHVTLATPTKNGIPFEAKILKISEPGILKDRCDEAWHSVDNNLFKGVSIGFIPKEYEPIKGGGIRFKKWEWIELSLVTIPANTTATIEVIKKFDNASVIETEEKEKEDSDLGVSKSQQKSVNKQTIVKFLDIEENKMTFQEQLKALREKQETNAKSMQDIINKSAESGQTLTDEEGEKFDTLTAECEAIEKQIKRIEALEKVQVKSGKVIEEVNNKVKTTALKSTVQLKDSNEKGMNFARSVLCLIHGKGKELDSMHIAQKHFADNQVVQNITKAAVEAGNTGDPNWVGALVGEEANAVADYNEYLRPRTLVGQFGTNNIPALRNIGFRVPIISQNSIASGYWVGEGKAKPLTKAGWERTKLEELKVANIAALTQESIKLSNPDAARLVRDELSRALIATIDISFMDYTFAGSDVRPAGITYGSLTKTSAGPGLDAFLDDLEWLKTQFIINNNPLNSSVFIVDGLTASRVSSLRDPISKVKLFPEMTLTGGFIDGIPVIVSNYLPRDTSGGMIALVNADDIYLADGAIRVDSSDQVSLEMSDTPVSDSVTPTGATSMVSMWQTNSVAFRAEKFINWRKVPGRVGVAYITGVNY